MIKFEDLNVGINGSGNLPVGYLRDALSQVEKAWQKTVDPSLAKKAINSWLGLYAADHQYSYIEKCFRDEDALPSYNGEQRLHHYECGLLSVGYKVEQLTGRSHRPFHQWVIDQEHLLIAQCRHLLNLPPRHFKELRVDSILLQAGGKEHKKLSIRFPN